MTEINWWKDNPDYEAGLKLAIKYEASETLLVLLRSGANSYTHKKLAEFLTEVNDRLLASSEKKKVTAKQNEKFSEPVITDLLPLALQNKIRLKGKLVLEAADLHSRLDLYDSDEKRRSAAGRILAIYDEINGIWDEIDYFTENGKLMTKKDSLEGKSIAELFSLKERYTNYIYRNRKQKKHKLVKKYEELLESVNNLINDLAV